MENYVITIARSYGSGGRTLGKKLADEFGIKYYDRELIRMASDESGISEALFGELDESMKRLPLFKNSGNVLDGEVLSPESSHFTSKENLLRYQAKIIREIADRESCIIVGRASDYVLKGRENVARLFFYASRKNCIERVIAQQGGTVEEVTERIEKTDRYRANYYKYITGSDWNNVTNYDFCIDTGSMDYDKLIRVVRGYLTEKFGWSQ